MEVESSFKRCLLILNTLIIHLLLYLVNDLVAEIHSISFPILYISICLSIRSVIMAAIRDNLCSVLVSTINSLQESLKLKDIYNASIIHELRNPLNAILGSISLLRLSKSLSREDYETLNIAAMSGEILITLINNSLDGAKL